jgi:hypothetical protein
MKHVFSVLIKFDTFIIGSFTAKSCLRNATLIFVMIVSVFKSNRMDFHEILHLVRTLLKLIDNCTFV